MYFFILGKDWEISLAELSTILSTSNYIGKIIDHSKNVAVVEFEAEKDIKDIHRLQKKLGGIQKIGKIKDEIPKESLKKAFPVKIYDSQSLKENRSIVKKIFKEKLITNLIDKGIKSYFFALSIYPSLFSTPDINLSKAYIYLNKFIKSEIANIHGIRTKYFRYPEDNVKSGKINPIWPHNVHNYSLLSKKAAEIVLVFTRKKSYLGKTISADNPNLNKMIDEERPHAPFSISTSPKISKILLNLANIKENGVVLDCFCGSGTTLIMALLQGINIFGTDISHDKVEMTRKNLTWISNKLKLKLPDLEKRVLQLDAKNLTSVFKPDSIDAIITEPFLGPTFRKSPRISECEKLIENTLNPLYKKVFEQISIVLRKNGRVALTTPIFLLKNNNELAFEIKNIIDKEKFRRLNLLPKKIFVNTIPKNVNTNQIFIKKRKKFVFRRINVIEKI